MVVCLGESARIALLWYSTPAAAEVRVLGNSSSATASLASAHCTKPRIQLRVRSFCMRTEPITSFRYRLVDDETKPDLPLRETSGSLSIDLNLDHEPRKLLSSARSHETSLPSLPISLTVNCELLTTELQWHFSAQLNQRSPRSPRSTVGWVGRGVRSSRCLIVVVVSLFVILGRCVAQSTRRRC